MANTLNGSRAVTKLYTSVASSVLTTANQNGATFPAFNVSGSSSPTTPSMFDDHTCVLMQVSTNHTRTVIDNTTFCSGGGEAIDPGRDSTEVSCDVVESVKYAVSNPDYLFTSRQKLPMIFALDTVSGLVYSAMILPTGRRVGAEAWAAYRGGWQARVDYTYIYPTWIAPAPA